MELIFISENGNPCVQRNTGHKIYRMFTRSYLTGNNQREIEDELDEAEEKIVEWIAHESE